VDGISDYLGYLLHSAFTRAARITARRFGSDEHPREAAAIASLNAYGPLSQQQLAKGLNVNRSAMVKLIDRLEERGYVERIRNPADRRAYALHATEAGLASMTEMLPRMAQAEAELTANLSSAEHERLNALLLALIDPPPPELANRTGFLLARAHHRFHERADEVLKPYDVLVREFGTLSRLVNGVTSQRELADQLQVSEPVVVELVDTMEAKALVERRRDPGDRRLNALHVTRGGRDVLERATAVLLAANEDLTGPIGEEGDRELRSLLRKLLGYG
jgi:DNA-binding MarR family transcriptional regulator